MKYDLIPVNSKFLLKRATLEVSEEEKETVGFIFQEATKMEVEYFQIVELAKECTYKIHKGDIVTVENYTPIGVFDGIEMFVCEERLVTCRILPVNVVVANK